MRKQTLIIVAALLALAQPAAALSKLEREVARNLERFQIDADIEDLRPSQVAALHTLFHGGRSHGDKRRLAKSIVGGRNSLRGVLFGDR